jgi:predicted peptidase
MALIDAFKKESEAVISRFEARAHQSDWVMPYRLFRPDASGPLPLVLFLHGSGGMGDDNLRQIGLGNIFGTRVWALPGNQKKFPCYVVAPQTDRGWVRYRPLPPATAWRQSSPAWATVLDWPWRSSTRCAVNSPSTAGAST